MLAEQVAAETEDRAERHPWSMARGALISLPLAADLAVAYIPTLPAETAVLVVVWVRAER